ncbi:MAG: hypothetical protein JXB05_16060 [Myxococcaceae bacterium]|nr:hypothetical protein [Myxococcaceae bacterium]
MSCGIACVNRTLSVLAAVWGLVPMVLVATSMEAAPLEERAQAPAVGPQRPELREPCPLGEARGLARTLCLATAHPNRKKDRVTNGR